MTKDRYHEASQSKGLTDEEIEQGWHFCPEWAGMLSNKAVPESISCKCELSVKEEA